MTLNLLPHFVNHSASCRKLYNRRKRPQRRLLCTCSRIPIYVLYTPRGRPGAKRYAVGMEAGELELVILLGDAALRRYGHAGIVEQGMEIVLPGLQRQRLRA